MKLSEAIRILIEFCGRYSRGSGTGISERPNHGEQKLMALAAKRAFRRAYKREPEQRDLMNIGYSRFMEDSENDTSGG